MIFPASNHRLGTSFVTHEIYLEMIMIFTYITVFNIRLFGKLLYPETIFFSRKSRDSKRRCHINVVFVKDPGMIRPG
jgi:hypothetical protein